MHLASTVKEMFRSDNSSSSTGISHSSSGISIPKNSPAVDAHLLGKGEYSLPPGTGPGTSGKPVTTSDARPVQPGTHAAHTLHSDISPKQDYCAPGLVASQSHDSSFASSTGGFVADRPSKGGHAIVNGWRSNTLGDRDLSTNTVEDSCQSRLANDPLVASAPSASQGRVAGAATGETHSASRLDHPFHLMPPGNVPETTLHLQPVVHETTYYHETEEVLRQKENERHISHLQVSYQPVNHHVELPEKVEEVTHPVTHVREQHASHERDIAALTGLLEQHQELYVERPKEKHVVDNGVVEKEIIHHHVIDVIQPIINQETTKRHRIQTLIPSHHEIHEAPIVHQARTLKPVTMSQFTAKYGASTDALSRQEAVDRLLASNGCTREVDEMADQLAENVKINGGAAPRTKMSRGNPKNGDFVPLDAKTTSSVQDFSACIENNPREESVLGGGMGMSGHNRSSPLASSATHSCDEPSRGQFASPGADTGLISLKQAQPRLADGKPDARVAGRMGDLEHGPDQKVHASNS